MAQINRNKRTRHILMAAAAASLVPLAHISTAPAATITWNNATPPGLWSSPASWSGNAIPVAADTVNFTGVGSSITQGTLTNEVDQSFTVSSINYSQQSDATTPQFHTTQIDAGQTLTINGTASLMVGNTTNAATAYSVFTTIGGGGSLVINNTGAIVSVRQGSNAASFTGRSTLDLAGLGTFSANVSRFEVGVGGASTTSFNRAAGTVLLAPSSSITAGTISVGTATASNPAASQLTFNNSTTLNANLIEFGTRKAVGNANFAASVAGGNIVIRNQAGTGRANLTISQSQASEVSTTNSGGTLDFTGDGGATRGTGTVDFLLGSLAIARGNSQAGTATQGRGVGRLSYEAGTVDVNDVTLGEAGGAAGLGTSTGTLDVKGSGLLVVNNNMTLGQNSVGAIGTGIPVGVLNVGAAGSTASARVVGDILDGGGISRITVTDATLTAAHIGTTNAIDTLTISGAKLQMNIGATAGSSVLSLVANGANTVTPGLSGGVTVGSDYVLIDYTTISGTGFGSFTLGKLPPRMVANLVDNAGNTSIDLHVTSYDSPKWTGNGDKTWNLASTNNWQLINAGTPTTYQENLAVYTTGDNVLFDDTSANGNVNVTTTVSPGSIIVNNSSTGYTFGGTGAIAGAPALTKSGTQTLTITTPASLGTIAINGGNVILGNNSTAGSGNGATGPISIASGAALTINRIDNSTIGGAISGAGSLVHTGSGITTLAGANTYTGDTTISNGIVKATSNASLGSLTNGIVTVSGTGSVDVGGYATADAANFGQKQFNISGAGPGGGIGVLTNSSTANRQINAFQKVTLTADATVGGAGRFDVRSPSASPGAAVLDLAGFTLTKVGAGNFSIVRADATPGNIHVVGGIFNIEGSSNVTGAGTVTYDPGTTAQFNGPTGTISRNMVMNGNSVFDAGQAATVNIASPVSFAGGTVTMNINTSTGFSFSGDITQTAATGLAKTGNGTLVLSGATGYTGPTSVSAGTLRVTQNFRSSSALNVSDGARAVMVANGNNVLQTGTLNLNATGTLDLADNDLVVDNGNFTEIKTLVLTGFGSPSGGIISSTSDGSQILALFDNALIGAGDWNGGTIGPNAIVGKYTYFGDVNFDGQVTGDDYTIIDSNLNTTPPVGLEWLSGDANLDGIVTGDDYTTIDSNLGLGAGNPLSASSLGGMAAVPEPTSVGVIAMGGAAMLARRRRTR